MGYMLAWVEGNDHRRSGMTMAGPAFGRLVFFPGLKHFFIPTSQKRIFFLPCPERKMQQNVASLEETSAQTGFGEELVFLRVLQCSSPALCPPTV